ncbi:hypothetical protein Tco_1307199 [Tanacetum coccineum]
MNLSCIVTIQANMDIKDVDYFHQLFQLKQPYRVLEIPNDGFPEHYFNFASYNELPARANGRNVIFTESIHQEILQQIASVEEQ